MSVDMQNYHRVYNFEIKIFYSILDTIKGVIQINKPEKALQMLAIELKYSMIF